MADWLKEELTLREDHTWRAKPGCKIFVADRGALRLDYPEDWVVIPGENSINFHDRQPPDDDIHMEVWPKAVARATKAWDDALGSLELGMYIEDPTKGYTLH